MSSEVPTFSQFAMLRLSSFANRRASNTRKAKPMIRVNVVLNAIVRVVLHLAGFSLLTMAGFTFSMLAGLIVAGVSCFALSTLMTRNTADEQEANRAPDLRTGR